MQKFLRSLNCCKGRFRMWEIQINVWGKEAKLHEHEEFTWQTINYKRRNENYMETFYEETELDDTPNKE